GDFRLAKARPTRGGCRRLSKLVTPVVSQSSQAQIDALLERLNPAQQEAVTHGDGPLLIFAGAGSGKTRVLTARIAYLIASHRVWPDRLPAVTFTNKAAREMRRSAERRVGKERNSAAEPREDKYCTYA